MTLEWFRDLVLVIFGLGATLAIIALVAMAFMAFLRLMPILDSVKKTTRTVERLSSCVEEEVARPLAQVVSFIQGVKQAVGLFSRFTGKKEED